MPVHTDKNYYTSLEYRCPKCNKLVVKGMLLKGYVEFKCLRCRTLFGFHGPSQDAQKAGYLILSTPDGIIRNCSTSVTALLGYTPNELVGKNISVLYAHEEHRTTDRLLATRTRTFKYLRFDTEHQKKDGTSLLVTVTLKPLTIGGQSQIVRLVHSVPPIRQGLLRRGTFDMRHHSDFDAEFDLEGNIVYADRRACELSGYLPEELIGNYWFDFAPPEEVARRKANMQDLFASCSSYRVLDSRVRIKDGSIVEYEVFATPSYDDFGNLVGYKFMNWLKP